MKSIVAILTNGNPEQIGLAIPALLLSFLAIWLLRGRGWAFIYVALIPFLNWSFGIIPEFQILAPTGTGLTAQGVSLHPMTMVTGMVFVVRDFVQREMGHRVLLVMAMAIAWSFYYAWPVIALASGIAFAIAACVELDRVRDRQDGRRGYRFGSHSAAGKPRSRGSGGRLTALSGNTHIADVIETCIFAQICK